MAGGFDDRIVAASVVICTTELLNLEQSCRKRTVRDLWQYCQLLPNIALVPAYPRAAGFSSSRRGSSGRDRCILLLAILKLHLSRPA